VKCAYEWLRPWGWSERRPHLVDLLRLAWFVVKKEKPTYEETRKSLPVAGWLSVNNIQERCSGKKRNIHYLFFPSWLFLCPWTESENDSDKNYDKRPTGCPRFDPFCIKQCEGCKGRNPPVRLCFRREDVYRSCMCATRLICICDIAHCVLCDSCMCATRRIRMCDMTDCVRCVASLILYVWHNLLCGDMSHFIGVTRSRRLLKTGCVSLSMSLSLFLFNLCLCLFLCLSASVSCLCLCFCFCLYQRFSPSLSLCWAAGADRRAEKIMEISKIVLGNSWRQIKKR